MSKDCMDIARDAAVDAGIERETNQARAIEAQQKSFDVARKFKLSYAGDIIPGDRLAALFSTASRLRELEKQLRDEKVLAHADKARVDWIEKNGGHWSGRAFWDYQKQLWIDNATSEETTARNSIDAAMEKAK